MNTVAGYPALAGAVLFLSVMFAPPATAHTGDGRVQPVLERVSVAAPALEVTVAYSANWQLIVSNKGTETVTFLADSGEPFLEIGPGGTRGNFSSPTFYDSNVPEGLTKFPKQAQPGVSDPPIWKSLSAQPNWGWFDHRLHPANQGAVPPEAARAGRPTVLGRWEIPVRVADQTGVIQGRFEFRPPNGSWTMVQTSSRTPSDGVIIQVAPGPALPAVFVENLSAEPLVVLGQDNEPFARIGPRTTDVNAKSPTWARLEQAFGKDPSNEVDAAAEPRWQQVADSPRWSWLEFRAAAPRSDPPQEVIAVGRTVTAKTWSVPYLIGERKEEITGRVDFVGLLGFP